MKRPGSLTEVAALGRSRHELGIAVVEFPDQSKIEKGPAMLAEQNLLVSENALHRA